MRLYQLEGFYRVGVAGGYAAAARAMRSPVGQPAVYQQVRRLEEDLGVLLVRPEGKRVHLTPEGRMMHDFIAPFFSGLLDIERRIKVGRGGMVVIAATDVLTDDFLPAKLRRLRTERPSIAVSVRELGTIDDVVDAVRHGTADFGLSHFSRPPAGLKMAEAGRLDVLLATPVRHALARRRNVSLEDVARQPLVAYEQGSFARSVMDGAFKGLRTQVVAEASTSALQLRYVREGLGVALIPRVRRALQREPGIAFIPVVNGFPAYAIQLIWAGGSSDALDGVRSVICEA